MNKNDFIKIAKEFVNSKKPGAWTSFMEDRLYNVGKDLETKKIGADQAIDKIKSEIKAYNVNLDDVKNLKEKIK
jgi:cob(I)alamin adenosyltransferase